MRNRRWDKLTISTVHSKIFALGRSVEFQQDGSLMIDVESLTFNPTTSSLSTSTTPSANTTANFGPGSLTTPTPASKRRKIHPPASNLAGLPANLGLTLNAASSSIQPIDFGIPFSGKIDDHSNQ